MNLLSQINKRQKDIRLILKDDYNNTERQIELIRKAKSKWKAEDEKQESNFNRFVIRLKRLKRRRSRSQKIKFRVTILLWSEGTVTGQHDLEHQSFITLPQQWWRSERYCNNPSSNPAEVYLQFHYVKSALKERKLTIRGREVSVWKSNYSVICSWEWILGENAERDESNINNNTKCTANDCNDSLSTTTTPLATVKRPTIATELFCRKRSRP